MQAAARRGPKPKTQIVMLGTGTPRPDPERSGPATAIVANGTPYLVDFGPGVVRRVVGDPRLLSLTVSVAAWPRVGRRTHSPLPLDQAVMMVAAGSALPRIQ
jgi:hypothetical protein